MPKSERVRVENVNVPGYTHPVDATMYHAMLQALMQVLPDQSPSLTQAEMLAALIPNLPEELFPGGAKAGWWMKTAHLDQEAKGTIVLEKSVPKGTPTAGGVHETLHALSGRHFAERQVIADQSR